MFLANTLPPGVHVAFQIADRAFPESSTPCGMRVFLALSKRLGKPEITILGIKRDADSNLDVWQVDFDPDSFDLPQGTDMPELGDPKIQDLRYIWFDVKFMPAGSSSMKIVCSDLAGRVGRLVIFPNQSDCKPESRAVVNNQWYEMKYGEVCLYLAGEVRTQWTAPGEVF